MTDDKITKLPVRFKKPTPEERSIVHAREIGKPEPCMHSPLFGCTYVVDDKLAEVECGRCGAKLSPIWVLSQIAHHDRRLHESQTRYQQEQVRLAERSRTKCEKCGHMTRISRR